MLDNIKRLTELLIEKNPELSEEKAMLWVELLWSDYESTSARAGHKYQGADYTEKVIGQLIYSYGDNLHLFIANNSKYADLLVDPIQQKTTLLSRFSLFKNFIMNRNMVKYVYPLKEANDEEININTWPIFNTQLTK